MAGSWTCSGNGVGGQQPHREVEATHLCEHSTRRAASSVRGRLERAPRRRFAHPARAVSGLLGKAMVVTGSTSPGPDPDTHRDRLSALARPQKGDKSVRFLASLATVVNLEFGDSRTRHG